MCIRDRIWTTGIPGDDSTRPMSGFRLGSRLTQRLKLAARVDYGTSFSPARGSATRQDANRVYRYNKTPGRVLTHPPGPESRGRIDYPGCSVPWSPKAKSGALVRR